MLVYQVSICKVCSQLQNLPLSSVKYVSATPKHNVGNDTSSIINLCIHTCNYVEVKKQKEAG